jgi:hypothetical protein
MTDQSTERSQTIACINGRWVPAVSLKAPVDVRWVCHHRWTPHVHSSGDTSWTYFDCLSCGVGIEAGSQPDDGQWKLRSQIAERVWWRHRRQKASR